MYFDFEDQRPDTPTIARPLSPREGVMLSVIIHLVAVILILVGPHLPFMKAIEARRQQALEAAAAEGTGTRAGEPAVRVRPAAARHAGPQAAAARRSLGHRSAGAHDAARAEADQSDAVRARQHHASGSRRRRQPRRGATASPQPQPETKSDPSRVQPDRHSERDAGARRRSPSRSSTRDRA